MMTHSLSSDTQFSLISSSSISSTSCSSRCSLDSCRNSTGTDTLLGRWASGDKTTRGSMVAHWCLERIVIVFIRHTIQPCRSKGLFALSTNG